jgi:hypothetical protein
MIHGLNNVGDKEHIYRQYGYTTGASVKQYTISMGKISIGAPRNIIMEDRTCPVRIAPDEFYDQHSRCPKEWIYVPDHMNQAIKIGSPMSFTPTITFWCLAKYSDEALQWAYQIIVQNIEAKLEEVRNHSDDLNTYLGECNAELSRRLSQQSSVV